MSSDDQHNLFAAIVRSHLADVTELAAERRANQAGADRQAEPTDKPSTSSSLSTWSFNHEDTTSSTDLPPLDDDALLALDLFGAELQRIAALLDDHALAQQLAQEDAEEAARAARDALAVAMAAEGRQMEEEQTPEPHEETPEQREERLRRHAEERARLADEAARAYFPDATNDTTDDAMQQATRARQQEFARLVRERMEERERLHVPNRGINRNSYGPAAGRTGAATGRGGAATGRNTLNATNREQLGRPRNRNSATPSLASLINQIPNALAFWRT